MFDAHSGMINMARWEDEQLHRCIHGEDNSSTKEVLRFHIRGGRGKVVLSAVLAHVEQHVPRGRAHALFGRQRHTVHPHSHQQESKTISRPSQPRIIDRAGGSAHQSDIYPRLSHHTTYTRHPARAGSNSLNAKCFALGRVK